MSAHIQCSLRKEWDEETGLDEKQVKEIEEIDRAIAEVVFGVGREKVLVIIVVMKIVMDKEPKVEELKKYSSVEMRRK